MGKRSKRRQHADRKKQRPPESSDHPPIGPLFPPLSPLPATPHPPPPTPVPASPSVALGLISALDSRVDPNGPRKVCIRASTDQKLSPLHPLLVKNFLFEKIGRPDDQKRLRSADIYVKTVNAQQTRRLLALTSFCTIPVIVFCPVSWNCVKGVISGRPLHPLSDDDLILCSEDSDGIIGSRHFMRKKYQTNLLILLC